MLGPDDDMIASRLKQTMKRPFKTPFKSSFALAPAGEEDIAAPVWGHPRKLASKASSMDPGREGPSVSRTGPKDVSPADIASGTGVIEIDSGSDEETSVLPSAPLPPTDIELDASYSTKFPVSNPVLLSAIPY